MPSAKMQQSSRTKFSRRLRPAPGFCKNVRAYFREYCASTTIHGFKYFGEKRTIFERIWWFIVFTTCLLVCGYSIFLVYMKWEQSPVIVSFATRGTPIFNIPFPAITICPETKFSNIDFNFAKVMKKISHNESVTQQERTLFEYTSLLCQNQQYFDTMNQTFSEDFFDILAEIQPQFNISYCQFMGKWDCQDMFYPILTDEGVCFTFNMMNHTDVFRNAMQVNNYLSFEHPATNWTLENGYPDDAPVDTYPRRALISGATRGLDLTIQSQKSTFDYACSVHQGYKAIIHTSTRIPRPSEQFFRIPLNQDVMAAVQPVMITTSDSVKRYNPQRRQCYFAKNEKELKFFNYYTSMNCMMECLANVTLEICACVGFFMPREAGTKICATGNLECMMEAEDLMYSETVNRNLLKTKRKYVNDTADSAERRWSCDCLPICSDLTYDVEVSQSEWDIKKIFEALGDEDAFNTSEYKFSTLNIYFKSSNFITSQRNELYGPTDFLANFGGLLGLFTGFSVLSLMEIIYFLTIRICCNVRLYGFWGGKEV